MVEYLKNLVEQNIINKQTSWQVSLIFEEFEREYDYLRIKEEQWDKLFREAVDYCLNKKNNIFELRKVLNRSINEYLKRLAAKKNTIFLNNLLIKLSKQNSKRKIIVHKFVEEIKKHKIAFDEDYFTKLKQESKIFQNILNGLGISTFEEFIDVYKGKYEDYLIFKPTGKTLKWTIDKVNYICKLSKKRISLKDPDYFNTDDYNSLKFLITHFSLLDQIYNLYISKIENCTRYLFDVAIFNYSYPELEALMNDYQNYLLFPARSDLTFLKRISNRVYRAPIVKEKPEPVAIQIEESFYELFPNFNLSEVVKKNYVNQIYDDLSLYDKTRIKNYFDNTINDIKERRNIHIFLNGLVIKYTRRVYNENSDVDALLPTIDNPNFSIYDYFPNSFKIAQEEKEKVINYLLGNRSFKIQALIKAYFAGKELTREEKQQILTSLNNMLIDYQKYMNDGSLDFKYTHLDLYSYMPDRDDITFEMKKIVTDYLVNYALDEVRFKRIDDYINKRLSTVEFQKDRVKASADIAAIKKYYNNWLKTKILPFPKEIRKIVVALFLNQKKVSEFLLTVPYEKINLWETELQLIENRFFNNGYTVKEYQHKKNMNLRSIMRANTECTIEFLIQEYVGLMKQNKMQR